MKVYALIQRLTRDLTQTNPSNLTAEERQTMQDCINAGLQTFYDHAPDHTKIVPISLTLSPPKTITIGVTQNSHEFTGYAIHDSEHYCTIRIDGDGIDNQIVGLGTLLHPYAGTTSTVNATIFFDAIALDGTYGAIASNPRYVDTDVELQQGVWRDRNIFRNFIVGEPDTWIVESNATSEMKSVFRVNRLPDRLIRLKSTAILTPPRVTFIDTTNAAAVVPMREEHIEAYLLPHVRGLLAETSLWRDPLTRQRAMQKGEQSEMRYREMTPKTIATPANLVGTPFGY